MRKAFVKAFLAAWLLCAISANAQVAKLSASEIEKRNAAAKFSSLREATLFLLLGECSHLMANSSVRMDVIARGWFDRNKPEMEAAYAWLDRYLSYLKDANPIVYKQASNDLVRSGSDGLLQNARTFFARKQPDIASCEKAAISRATGKQPLVGDCNHWNPDFQFHRLNGPNRTRRVCDKRHGLPRPSASQ